MNFKKLIKKKKFWLILGGFLTSIGLIATGSNEEGIAVLKSIYTLF